LVLADDLVLFNFIEATRGFYHEFNLLYLRDDLAFVSNPGR